MALISSSEKQPGDLLPKTCLTKPVLAYFAKIVILISMYSFVFAFIYHSNARGKGDDPRGVANMVLSLFQALHFLLLLLTVLYFLGITRADYGPIRDLDPILYGIILLLPFYIFNSFYFKGKRMENVLKKYDRKRVYKLVNIIILISLLVLPIVLLAATSEVRHGS